MNEMLPSFLFSLSAYCSVQVLRAAVVRQILEHELVAGPARVRVGLLPLVAPRPVQARWLRRFRGALSSLIGWEKRVNICFSGTMVAIGGGADCAAN